MNATEAIIGLRGAWRDWAVDDAQRVGYLIKVLLACLGAMWISMLFDLGQPRTAMVTVAIVMQSHSGMVLAKSYYRLIGTLAGVFASIALVALFAQERIPFLTSMALWIGFCTAGSVILRNHQSYAFVLAGYTLCIVGLPAASRPEMAFDIAVDRVSEITIGLFCATLVSELVFPKRIGGAMLDAARRRFHDFSAILASVSPLDAGYRQALMQLTGDIFSLEAFRASSVLESDESRSYRLRLGRMNAEFMEATTTFNTLGELLRRQRKGRLQDTADALDGVCGKIREALKPGGIPASNEREAAEVAARLSALRSDLDDALAFARKSADREKMDFDVGADLIKRLVDELANYARTYAALSRRRNDAQAPSLGIHFDPLAVSLAGIRGAIMLAIMASIWILTEWGSGMEAVTLGVVSSTLFATSPSPSHTIRQFLTGALMGAMFAYWTNFHLLVHAQGFLMLALAVSPGIALAAWLTTRPDRAVIGAGFFIVFLMHLGFGSSYSSDPASFMNDVIADLLAIMLSGMLYALIDIGGSRWTRRRTVHYLRKLVVDACREPMSLRREKLEISARDLVHRSGSIRRIADEADRTVVEWLLFTLEAGHAVIALREHALQESDGHLQAAVRNALEMMAAAFEAPSAQNRMAAIQALQMASRACGGETGDAFRRKTATLLHFLKGIIMDEDSVLAMEEA
jgi:uncharacterized membrane protein YccC